MRRNETKRQYEKRVRKSWRQCFDSTTCYLCLSYVLEEIRTGEPRSSEYLTKTLWAYVPRNNARVSPSAPTLVEVRP
jgi:hypothetical protein